MTLRINTSRAFRTLDEFETLVRAVVAADEHDELSWLEWKSTLNLGEKEGQFAVARAVLGLSNRSVADAALQCEGCGYVVVGADHTGLHGVSTVDLTVLEQGLAPYIGRGAGTPRWSPRYLDVDRQSILVITVEAPEFGDRIHTLRKTFGRVPAGAILVRGKAKVEAASPGEITMLEERLLAGVREPNMALEVAMQAPERFHPIQSPSDADMDAWVAESVDAIWEAAPIEARARSAAHNPWLTPSLDLTSDQRTKFRQLISAYEAECRRILPQALIRTLIESDINKLAIRVANGDDSILTNVLLVAELDASTGDLKVEPPERSRLPKRPRWHDAAPFALRSRLHPTALADSMHRISDPGSPIIEHDGDIVRVTWSLGDIHVRQSVTGEQITVIPTADADQVRIRWRASSSNRTGVIEGEWVLFSAPDHSYRLAHSDGEAGD